MRKLNKLFFAFLLAMLTIASCSKSDYDNSEWEAEQRRLDSLNRVRIAELLEKQAPELEAFAKTYFENPQFDDSTGVWYQIHDMGETGSYEYALTSGLVLPRPEVEVKYSGKLLDGSVFDETLQEPTGDDEEDADTTRRFQLGTDQMGNGLIQAWNIAFYPTEFRINGKDYYYGGLTEKGLQKGAIIEFVVPSPYGYDNKEIKDKDGNVTIPKDSPLHFYIEVVDIEDPR